MLLAKMKQLSEHRSFLLFLSVFLLIDAGIGLRHGWGLFPSSGLFYGDLEWILPFLQWYIGLVILLKYISSDSLNLSSRIVFIVSTLVTFILVLLSLEFVISGREQTAVVTWNLAAIGFSGLYWAAAYLSIAIGLTLTYKVQGYGNFAQGEFLLLGSYISLTLMWSERFSEAVAAPKDDLLSWELLLWACVAGFVITGIIGVIIDKCVYRGFRKRNASSQTMMIASLGVAMILRALVYLRYTARSFLFVPDKDWRLSTSKFDIATRQLKLNLNRAGFDETTPLFEWVTDVNDYGFTFAKTALVIGVFSSVILLMIVFKKTSLGRKMRAVSDNPSLAASSGINIERMHTISSFLSAGLSGLGGALLVMVLRINPEVGFGLLLPAFVVIVLGTIGSIQGAIVGSLLIGFVRASSEPVMMGVGSALERPTFSAFAETMPYVFLIGVLLIMPQGIGDAYEKWNIERIRKRAEKRSESDQSQHLSVIPSKIAQINSTISGKIADISDAIMQPLRKLSATIESKIADTKHKLKEIWNKIGLSAKLSSVVAGSKKSIQNKTPESMKNWLLSYKEKSPFGRQSPIASNHFFIFCTFILVIMAWNLPSVNINTKILQIARLIVLVCIFTLLSMSLNMHTGMAGMTNFGVIFFAGIAAVTAGIVSAPSDLGGRGWEPWMAMIAGATIAGIAGWMLAYPTANLRMDYFAIVTISLGEILRIGLQAEPLLRAGVTSSAIGISKYKLPLSDWWKSGPNETVGGWLGLESAAPHVVLLAAISVVILLVVWWVLNRVYASPWGRILRSIREDEEVSQHHGHNVFMHKATALAAGAIIAGIGGIIWAWLNTSIWPDFLNPVRSTFLIWAAFIVGGKANDRGMFVGAFLIVILDFVFNVMVVARGDTDLAFHSVVSTIDDVFAWFVQDFGLNFWSQQSIDKPFPNGRITAELAYVKLALVGVVILAALRYAPKGLIPEVPFRPGEVVENGGEEQ